MKPRASGIQLFLKHQIFLTQSIDCLYGKARKSRLASCNEEMIDTSLLMKMGKIPEEVLVVSG